MPSFPLPDVDALRAALSATLRAQQAIREAAAAQDATALDRAIIAAHTAAQHEQVVVRAAMTPSPAVSPQQLVEEALLTRRMLAANAAFDAHCAMHGVDPDARGDQWEVGRRHQRVSDTLSRAYYVEGLDEDAEAECRHFCVSFFPASAAILSAYVD